MFTKDHTRTHQINDEFFCLWCVEQDENVAAIRVWNKNSDKLPYLCCWEYDSSRYKVPYVYNIKNMGVSDKILTIIAVAFAAFDERFQERAKSLKDINHVGETVKTQQPPNELTVTKKGGEQKMSKLDFDVMDCITNALSSGANKDRVSGMLTHYLLSTENNSTTEVTNETNETVETVETVEEIPVRKTDDMAPKLGLSDEDKKKRQEENRKRRQRRQQGGSL